MTATTLATVAATVRPIAYRETLRPDVRPTPSVLIRQGVDTVVLPVADLEAGAALVESLRSTAHEVLLLGTEGYALTGSPVVVGGYLHGRPRGDWR